MCARYPRLVFGNVVPTLINIVLQPRHVIPYTQLGAVADVPGVPGVQTPFFSFVGWKRYPIAFVPRLRRPRPFPAYGSVKSPISSTYF